MRGYEKYSSLTDYKKCEFQFAVNQQTRFRASGLLVHVKDIWEIGPSED